MKLRNSSFLFSVIILVFICSYWYVCVSAYIHAGINVCMYIDLSNEIVASRQKATFVTHAVVFYTNHTRVVTGIWLSVLSLDFTVSFILQDPRFVPGAGATEIELAKQLTEYAEVSTSVQHLCLWC